MESAGSVNIVSTGAYVVCDGDGDIGTSEDQGLFYRDTRHLSQLLLVVNGERPALRSRRSWGAETEALAVFGDVDGGLDVVRRRSVADSMREKILFANRTKESVEVRIELRCDADFRDLFEVRGYVRPVGEQGELTEEVGEGALSFFYRRDDFRRGTEVRVAGDGIGARAEPGRILCDLEIWGGKERTIEVSVSLWDGTERVQRGLETSKLYVRAPVLETDWENLSKSWERSLEDLKLLSFEVLEGLSVPAAGAPWYMALFGRDANIIAYQALLLDPEPTRNVLRALTSYQAEESDDFRDAEPGKILHELRLGSWHTSEKSHTHSTTAPSTPPRCS